MATHTRATQPHVLKERWQEQRTGISFLKFFQAVFTCVVVESSQPLAAESTVYKCFKTVVAMLRENNLQGNLENAWKVNEKSKNFKTNGFRSLDKLYLFHLGANGIISGKIILTQKYLSPSLFGLKKEYASSSCWELLLKT